MKKAIFFLMALFLLPVWLVAEMRLWRSKDGECFNGEYVTERLDRYYFRDLDGKTRIVPVEDLCLNDVKYIQTLAPPKMRLTCRVQKNSPEGRYADPDTEIIEGTLVVEKTGRQPFDGTLTGEVYLIGDEVATDHYKMLAKKKFTFKFPEGKKPSFEIKLSGNARVYEEYNGLGIRGREYEGYVAVIFSPTGDVAEFKTDINWMTLEKLEALRQLELFNFFNEKCQKTAVPRLKYVPRWYR